MLDPVFVPPPLLTKSITPIAQYLNLTTLPLHAHEIIGAFCFYSFLFVLLSPYLSNTLFPSTYLQLPTKTKVNWNVHVVSLVQSSLICVLGLWVIWEDKERARMSWRERIWGYTGAGGMVQAFAAGYFLWDLLASAFYLDVLGPGSLAHAASALIVTVLGFRPFANYYGLNFMLYELSTPFLNFHWFFDKLHMTGSRAQLYNGIALITVFGFSRLVWGVYQSLWIYHDIWKALQSSGPISSAQTLLPSDIDVHSLLVKERSGTQSLPMWLVYTYLGSNTMLTFLNFYWFYKMVQAVMKRFINVKDPSKRVNLKAEEKKSI